MVTKKININGLNLDFDKISLFYDLYMIWYQGEIVANIEQFEIRRFKHKETKISFNKIDKLVIFTMK